MVCPKGYTTSGFVQRGFNDNVLGGYTTSGCVQRGFNGIVLGRYPTSGCVQRGFNGACAFEHTYVLCLRSRVCARTCV